MEARVRGAPRVPLAVGVSKGPGSSFRVYEVTGCGARYVWHHKSEVAALEFLVRKLKRVARASKEKGGARHGRLQARDGGRDPQDFGPVGCRGGVQGVLTVCAALDEAEKEEEHGDVELD